MPDVLFDFFTFSSFCYTNLFMVLFASVKAPNDYNDPPSPPLVGLGGGCMPTSTASAIQKPTFSNIETGVKFVPNQAEAVAVLSPTSLYNERPRKRLPRNSTHFNFDYRASFHGRG